MLHLDFETRSECDLLKEGAYKYAAHPSTRVICAAWAIDDGTINLWKALEEKLPGTLSKEISRNKICAHNAQFERLILHDVLGIVLPIESFCCTSAQARYNGMPGALFKLGQALGIKGKQSAGPALIKECCVPPYNEEPHILAQLYSYCIDDVSAEREAYNIMQSLGKQELADYHMSEHINDRGIMIDKQWAGMATGFVIDENRESRLAIYNMTKGRVETPRQFGRIKAFLETVLTEEQLKVMARGDKISFDRSVRAELLTDETLTDNARDFIQRIDDAGNSSVSKYQTMINLAGKDDRVRGAYQYYGAMQTGRFSSIGLQVHNLSRATAKDPDAVIEHAKDTGEMLKDYGGQSTMEQLRNMIRPTIVAPANATLVWGDFANIESRVLAWLAGDQAKLDLYHEIDENPEKPDIYMHVAADILRYSAADITSAQRQVGKVAELALGFAGGVGAFSSMARGYGIKVAGDHAADIRDAWRASNWRIVEYWDVVERAAMAAIYARGTIHEAGRVKYQCQTDGALYCLLPSGRILRYPQARIEEVLPPWVEEEHATASDYKKQITAMRGNWYPARGAKEWPRARLWRGVLIENIVQATAANLLIEALHRLGDVRVILHSHDEILIEDQSGAPDSMAGYLKKQMETTPAWAAGIPIVATTDMGARYRK